MWFNAFKLNYIQKHKHKIHEYTRTTTTENRENLSMVFHTIQQSILISIVIQVEMVHHFCTQKVKSKQITIFVLLLRGYCFDVLSSMTLCFVKCWNFISLFVLFNFIFSPELQGYSSLVTTNHITVGRCFPFFCSLLSVSVCWIVYANGKWQMANVRF